MAGDFSLRTSNLRERERGKKAIVPFVIQYPEVRYQFRVLWATWCSVEGAIQGCQYEGVLGTILKAGYHACG